MKISRTPPIKYRKWKNPRTGKNRKVPEGIDPGWDYNPGEAGYQRLMELFEEKIQALPPDMYEAAENAGVIGIILNGFPPKKRDT